MLGSLQRGQKTLFIPGSIEDYLPEDHILVKVDKILDLGWLEKEVADLYCQNNGRRSIAPEAAMRLMLAGFFLGVVHDRKLMREAQVNLAIRWFAENRLRLDPEGSVRLDDKPLQQPVVFAPGEAIG